jgi:hypothetical protein
MKTFKNMIILQIFLTTLLFNSFSSANTPDSFDKYRSEEVLRITSGQFSNFHLGSQFQNGELKLNIEKGYVSLILNEQEPLLFQVDSVNIGACGKTIIQASRSENGVIDQLRILDNATLLCRIFLPYRAVAHWTRFDEKGEFTPVESKFFIEELLNTQD